jgi:hypothetical protein
MLDLGRFVNDGKPPHSRSRQVGRLAARQKTLIADIRKFKIEKSR